MLTDREERHLLAAIAEVANRETDHTERHGIFVDRDENGGISIILSPGDLDLEPEE
jgi:hypothetical protein